MTLHTPFVPERVAHLQPYVDAAIFDATEVHLAEAVSRLGDLTRGDQADDQAVLGVAVAAAGVRRKHVCIDLADVADRLVDVTRPTPVALSWPDPEQWLTALDAHPLVATPDTVDQHPRRPLVLDGGRIYLHRAWRDELTVYRSLLRRSESTLAADPTAIDDALRAQFGAFMTPGNSQVEACRVALTSPLAIIAGGPGTGKTYTVARLLGAATLLAGGPSHLQVALAAPTGKAAARMTEAVTTSLDEPGDVASIEVEPATTLHSLLRMGRDQKPRYHADHRLPHDLVIVDETSMVDLPLMAKLLEALRDDARLVLVGDPFQLASVDAGTVLRDLVGPIVEGAEVHAGAPLTPHITVLDAVHRFDADSAIASLAEALRTGDDDAAIRLLAQGNGIALVDPSHAVALAGVEAQAAGAAVDVVRAAQDGDGVTALTAATKCKVLAATRRGPMGLGDWSARIEHAVAAQVPELARHSTWYVGRPTLVTLNDHNNNVFNGDVGVVIATERGPVVALATGGVPRLIRPSRLRQVETWWAMTIHKSQGSEFDHVVVSLPEAESPILTRELLYTAVTRARSQVTIVATEKIVRAAVKRPVARASGLRERLWEVP